MTSTTVGLVRAGGMGAAIVRRLTGACHTVLVTSTDPADAAKTASDGAAGRPGTARGAVTNEVLGAEVGILALRFPTTVDFALAHRDQLREKVVIDLAVLLDPTFTYLTLEPTTSAAEELAKAVPDSRVVKAFNTVTAVALAAGSVENTSLDTFVAADDTDAKATVIGLLAGSGLRALDAGPLANSRLLERLTLFGMQLSDRYGLDYRIGLKMLPTGDLPAPP